MDCTVCTEPQCLYKGDLYLFTFYPYNQHFQTTVMNLISLPNRTKHRHTVLPGDALLLGNSRRFERSFSLCVQGQAFWQKEPRRRDCCIGTVDKGGQRGWQASRGGSARDLVVMPGRMGRGLRSTQEMYKLEKSGTTRAATMLRILKDLYLQQDRCEKLKCRSTKRALLYNCSTYTSPHFMYQNTFCI